MGSSSGRTLSFSGETDAALAEVQRALATIGAKVTSTDMTAGTLTATKGESFVSRGERLTVRIERLDGSCAIHVRSDSPDDIDWGRNAGNITQFEQALIGSSGARSIGAQAVDPSPLSAAFGGVYPPPAPVSPVTVTTPDSPAGRASGEAETPGPAPSIFGPSVFASVFASPTSTLPASPVSLEVAHEPVAVPPPSATDSLPASEVEAPPSPLVEADPTLPELTPTEMDALHAVVASGETPLGRLLLPLGEDARAEAQSLLSKLEARQAALEAGVSPAEVIERPPLRDKDRSWQQSGRTGTPPTREPEPETTVAEGRFFCSVDGEFGPVEPCARCGLYLCARHRRRSNQSVLYTNALYVCESCFQVEVAEQRGSNLNVRSATAAASFPSIQRTAEGWRMESGGKPANVWAALGTGVSLFLVVLFFTALSRSVGAFFFLLTFAVTGGYIWGYNVHWWTDEYLAAATPGRRRVIWLLATPGLFISGATLRLTQLACRAVGARQRAASLDATREHIFNAAEDAWNRALND